MINRLSQLKKILIANRGEIACRIIQTTKRLGIKSVAVYSEADATAKHVALADEAFCIGSPQATDSYLRGDKILEVARRSGAQAIHPGYGFLSENAEFAEDCGRSGVIFIGPPASAIRSMGVKSTSKKIMSDAGVPVVPGYHGDNQNVEFLEAKATEIGFPVMIKAIHGGGGKGMRIARTVQEFKHSLESAKNEAVRAFGNGDVLLEKFIESPRHVEVQVFGDKMGNTVHLFERDCSVQRRHQKVVEQAPGPGITNELRRQLGETGVKSAKAVGYVGAGTVEFIFDPADRNFYFMEMNTRLQVEHPVTEMITGVDLVEWQLRVCSGETLPMKQEEITLNGVAVETRVYAETLNSNGEFMPSAGRIKALSTPDTSKNTLRIESGINSGDEVSVYYDPMIAKVVVWGPDQDSAYSAMNDALSKFNIVGIDNNVGFLRKLVEHSELIKGNVNTDFITQHKTSLLPRPPTPFSLARAALSLYLLREKQASLELTSDDNPHNPFVAEPNFRVNSHFEDTLQIKYNESTHNIRVTKGDKWFINVDDAYDFDFKGDCYINKQGFVDAHLVSNDQMKLIRIYHSKDTLNVFDEDTEYVLEVVPKTKTPSKLNDSSDGGTPICPMPGVIDKVFVKPGDLVQSGDRLAVMVAMKMEYTITAKCEGRIELVHVIPGQSVVKNFPVVTFSTN